MKIIATVRASEFLSRNYTIECGKGNQFVHWIATTACMLFGQEHYPPGIYIPSLMTKDDQSTIPHPRCRINSKQSGLADGDSVIIHLKDRSRPFTEDEKDWYERAFSKKRNTMSYSVRYGPFNEQSRKDQFDFFVKFQYHMYPEMADEFDPADYQEEYIVQLEGDDDENDQLMYKYDIDLPYGDIKAQFFFKQKGKVSDEEEQKLSELPPKEMAYLRWFIEPEPVSAEAQRLLDSQEEEENKKVEHETRMRQKSLEEKKAREKYEQQQMIAKQEQNTARLEVYLKAMQLGIHRSDEDFNASLSILSIYHLDLFDNFTFYTSLHPQIFRKRENEMMTLQSFLHFLKVMNLALSRQEFMRICECLHEIIHPPIQDTLNVRNGINYAQFLESIIRIAYFRVDENGLSNHPEGYKNILDQVFSEGNIELKRRMMDDRMLSELYSQDNCRVFYEHFSLLAAIFTTKGMLHLETFLELQKEEFIHILIESGILLEGKDHEDKGAELKRKFDGQSIMMTIANVGSFDHNSLTYVDFLDCLVRVSFIYPFPEAEKHNFNAMDQKLEFIIGKLNDKYAGLIPGFIDQLTKKDAEMNYAPNYVLDDDAEDEDNDDDE